MSAIAPRIIFVCPPHFHTKWGKGSLSPIKDLFTSDGHLVIRVVKGGNYSYIEEGESPYYDYFSYYEPAGVTLNARRVGFSLRIEDKRDEAYLAFKELASIATSTGYANYKTMMVYDYARPEWEDYNRGYTIREGKIMGFEHPGAAFRSGYAKCDGTEVLQAPRVAYNNEGFAVRFMELHKRRVY